MDPTKCNPQIVMVGSLRSGVIFLTVALLVLVLFDGRVMSCRTGENLSLECLGMLPYELREMILLNLDRQSYTNLLTAFKRTLELRCSPSMVHKLLVHEAKELSRLDQTKDHDFVSFRRILSGYRHLLGSQRTSQEPAEWPIKQQ